MILHEMPQRSEDWFAVRLGKITSTSFGTMANGKPATIETLCYKVAAERITGVPSENGYTNAAMKFGVETEAIARLAYETRSFAEIQEVGFAELDEFIGVSPDGLVGEDGGVEIKCPQPHTHLQYLTGTSPWRAYKWQLQGCLWVTGRAWWDFVSFCAVFPAHMQLLVQRVMPDEAAFEKLAAGAEHCRGRIAEIAEAANG